MLVLDQRVCVKLSGESRRKFVKTSRVGGGEAGDEDEDEEEGEREIGKKE